MTKQEAYKLVGLLFTTYPNIKLTQENALAFVSALEDLPLDVATRGVERMRRVSKFLPSVAEIREAATDVAHGARKTGIEAWEVLGRAVRKFGWVAPPKITDPHLAFAVSALGGWTAVCSLREEAEMSARARFIEAYDGAARRERLDIDSGIPLPRATSEKELKP
jgi:hypothetical protein